MQYRPLGKTGLEVSALTLGGGFVGGLFVHQREDLQRAVLHRALEAGINWIDTAPLYGNGASEENLGKLLAELKDTPHISTKVTIDTRKGDLAGQVARSIEESLTRLRRDSVDLLQLHNQIEPETAGRSIGLSEVLKTGGVADALDAVREAGLTKHIGFTALGDAGACAQVIESGRFDTAQIYYNMLNSSAAQAMPDGWQGQDFGGLIDLARENDVAVLLIRVFASGVLATTERTGREIPITKEASLEDEERKAEAVFAALGDAHGGRAQTAVRFALSNADAATAIFGLADMEHLEEALTAEALGPLPPAAVEQIDKLYERGFT